MRWPRQSAEEMLVIRDAVMEQTFDALWNAASAPSSKCPPAALPLGLRAEYAIMALLNQPLEDTAPYV
jgi:hypothetical protein